MRSLAVAIVIYVSSCTTFEPPSENGEMFLFLPNEPILVGEPPRIELDDQELDAGPRPSR